MTAPVVSRTQAGLRPVAGVSTNITPGGPAGGVTAHYAGPSPGGFPWPHSRCASIWRADQAYHMDHNHWTDIAYTAGFCPHGFIFEGRWWHRRTAANGSNEGNQVSYAFCYMAGVGDLLTTDAKFAFLDLRSMAKSEGGAGDHVWPHDHWFNTACPGDPLREWIAAGLPMAGSVPPPAISTVPMPAHVALSAPMVALLPGPTGRGYIEVGADGGVFAYGEIGFHGSLPALGVVPTKPIVGGAITPSNGGYWLAGEDGGVYAFGDALFRGSMGGKQLNAPITDFASTPTGGGYWLLGGDGGIFAYGDATFAGSPV